MAETTIQPTTPEQHSNEQFLDTSSQDNKYSQQQQENLPSNSNLSPKSLGGRVSGRVSGSLDMFSRARIRSGRGDVEGVLEVVALVFSDDLGEEAGASADADYWFGGEG